MQAAAQRAGDIRSAGFKRVFALDPGLGPIPGHWATNARKLAAAFEARGLRVVACGHRRQDPQILEGLEVQPLFELTPYEPFGPDPRDKPSAREAFRAQTARFAADLEKLEGFGPCEDDLLLFLTIYPQILGGLIEWTRAKPERRRRRAALLLQFSEGVNVYDEVRGIDGDTYYIDYYRQIMPAGEGRNAYSSWRFFAASPGLGDLFSTLIGKDVRSLPMPGSAGWPPLRRRDGAGAVTVGVLGHTSIEKGALLLRDVILTTLTRFAHVRFNLHLSTNPDTRAVEAEFANGGDRLSIVRGYISDAEMQRMIDACDIVLLPYAPRKYRVMPSAIFVQAACAGKIVVLPAGSHMHREVLLRGGGAAVFREHSAAAIGKALSEAIRDVERLSQAAAAAAPVHREVNNPHAYVECILDAFA